MNTFKSVTTEMARITTIGMAIGAGLMLLYLAFEPVIGRAITDTFTISQSITGEVSFATPASDVTMTPAIASITGGTSTGATQVVVTTNDADGYSMTIHFSSSTAMNGDALDGSIPNYTPSNALYPDFTFQVPLNAAEFGYTIHASNTHGGQDVDSTFLDNGSLCGQGGSNATDDQCWMNPSTTPEQIIASASNLPASGSTSTIKFQLVVNANPSPSIAADNYTATATLTAVVQ